MKEYADLRADDPEYADKARLFAAKVRDVTEILTEFEPVAERQALPLTIAYHYACHLSHAQRVRSQPRQLLRGIPGLELHEVPDGDICCGSAGIYNILHPVAAREPGDRKAANVLKTKAPLLVTANPGCLMQWLRLLSGQVDTLPSRTRLRSSMPRFATFQSPVWASLSAPSRLPLPPDRMSKEREPGESSRPDVRDMLTPAIPRFDRWAA